MELEQRFNQMDKKIGIRGNDRSQHRVKSPYTHNFIEAPRQDVDYIEFNAKQVDRFKNEAINNPLTGMKTPECRKRTGATVEKNVYIDAMIYF